MRFLLSAVSVSFGSERGGDDARLAAPSNANFPVHRLACQVGESWRTLLVESSVVLKIRSLDPQTYFHCFLKTESEIKAVCSLYNRLLPASLPSSPPSQSLQWCIASGRRNPHWFSKATVWNIRVTVEKVTNSNNWLQIFSQVKWCWFIALSKAEGDVNYSLIVIFR